MANGTTLSDSRLLEERAVYHRPERAFDHGLPEVPVRAFYDELDAASAPAAPTGVIALDLGPELHLEYPATTPLLLARYCVVAAGDTLRHTFGGTGEVHCVLRGRGTTTNGAHTVHWGPGDIVCFPGGAETVHAAADAALLVTVTNEPDLAFAHAAPRPDSPVEAAVFRAHRIDEELADLHRVGGPQLTAGKSVSFSTPAMDARISGALMPSMMVAVNTLEPGGVQRRHRHNSVAITVPLAGKGTYSLIGEERVEWRLHGVIVTPPRLAHSHVNAGTEMMRSLVVQDGPVFYHCRSVGFEWTETVR
jgi:gentisate 1,2-dioxygenase